VSASCNLTHILSYSELNLYCNIDHAQNNQNFPQRPPSTWRSQILHTKTSPLSQHHREHLHQNKLLHRKNHACKGCKNLYMGCTTWFVHDHIATTWTNWQFVCKKSNPNVPKDNFIWQSKHWCQNAVQENDPFNLPLFKDFHIWKGVWKTRIVNSE